MVYKDPLLTYLLVPVPSILTVKYGKIQTKLWVRLGYKNFVQIFFWRSHRKWSGMWHTVSGQNIQTLDKLFLPRPPKFPPTSPQISKLFSFSKGLDGWTKEITPPQHDMWRTCCLTLTFVDAPVSCQSFPKGLNILSIYGTTYPFNKSFSELNQRHI